MKDDLDKNQRSVNIYGRRNIQLGLNIVHWLGADIWVASMDSSLGAVASIAPSTAG